jgi:hypothetical protein
MTRPEGASAIRREVIAPALAILGQPETPELLVLMLAICGQESGFKARAQVLNGGGKGPARGLWQFERGGGVRGLMTHRATHEPLRLLCRARDVAYDSTQIWMAMETDDILAAGCARLLLLSDPRKLPAVGDESGAWDYYLRNWRPGKPHPKRWPANYSAARAAL